MLALGHQVDLSVLPLSPEQILDASPDGVVIVDESGTVRLINRQAEKLFGYTRDELIGQPLELLVPESARDAHLGHRHAYGADARTRPMGAQLDLTARRKDGSEFPVDVALSHLRSPHGPLVWAAVRNVTERKRMEAEREALRAQVERIGRVAATASLEAQLQQAQRLETVGRLAGGVAHDFNNLLGGVMNYAALISVGIGDLMSVGGADEDACEVLLQDVDQVKKATKRAADLARQLLIFSRRDVVKPQVVDVNDIILDMEDLLRHTIGENIDLRITPAPDVDHVWVDPGQFEQVLMNLVVNAQHAMPTGGGIEIKTALFHANDEYAVAHQVEPGRYVRLTVSDTGIGMTADVASRAFEPFYTTKPKGEGTGLGLATVYGIVTQAGGDVAISPEFGLGTTIRINLPASDRARPTAHEISHERSLEAHGETILLVEDEETIRESAVRLLTRYGYLVLFAHDVDKALQVANEHKGRIDLLLTDVVMPRRSGKELAAIIARTNPQTRVLYMSGYSHDVIAHQGVVEEGVNLIEKPFATETLLEDIRRILDS